MQTETMPPLDEQIAYLERSFPYDFYEPPTGLLDKLDFLLDNFDACQPEVSNRKHLLRIERELYSGGVLQSTLEGAARWYSTKQKISDDLLASMHSTEPYSAQAIFGCALEYKKKRLANLDLSRFSTAPDRALHVPKSWFIRQSRSRFKTGFPYEGYMLSSPKWTEFLYEFEERENRINSLVLRCLQNCKVICFREDGGQYELIQTEGWSKPKSLAHSLGTRRKHKFLIVSQLPPFWFSTGNGPNSREQVTRNRAAERELASHCKKAAAVRQKIRKEDALKWLSETYSLSQSAAERVWKSVPKPWGTKGGRVPLKEAYNIDNKGKRTEPE